MTPSPCTGLRTAAATASTRVTDMQQQWQGPAHDRDAAHVCGHAHAHIHTHTQLTDGTSLPNIIWWDPPVPRQHGHAGRPAGGLP